MMQKIVSKKLAHDRKIKAGLRYCFRNSGLVRLDYQDEVEVVTPQKEWEIRKEDMSIVDSFKWLGV